MTYPEQVKSFLWSDVYEMSKCPEQFAKNPNADFSRKRKLDFENLMRFLISMESGTTEHELLKYFDYDINNVLSNSVFYQQRKKLLPDAFAHLLFQFNSHFPFEKYKGKYQLVACVALNLILPEIRMILIPFIRQAENPQKTLILYTQFPCMISLTKDIWIALYSQGAKRMNFELFGTY